MRVFTTERRRSGVCSQSVRKQVVTLTLDFAHAYFNASDVTGSTSLVQFRNLMPARSSRRPSRVRLMTLISSAEAECLQFSTETVKRQFNVADRGRKPVPEDWRVFVRRNTKCLRAVNEP